MPTLHFILRVHVRGIAGDSGFDGCDLKDFLFRVGLFGSLCGDVFWCYVMERHWIYWGRAMRAPLETTSTVLKEFSVMAALRTARCVSTDRSVQFI